MKLVFVHFGSKIPKHLLLNMDRTSKLFPKYEIILLTDQLKNLPVGNFVVKNNISQEDFDIVKNNLNHPIEFRNGFWFTTFVRLKAIAYLAEELGESILHIESDVILSPDFPMNEFIDLQTVVAFPLVSPGQAVASIFYIGDSEVAREFSEFLDTEIFRNPQTSDMRALDAFRLHSPTAVDILPTGPDLASVYQQTFPRNLLKATGVQLDRFRGIFDAIDIGFYLFGQDPRNTKGFRELRSIDSSSYLKIKSLNFKYNPERKFIDVVIDSLHLPVYSLHVHSKDLRIFKLRKFQKIALRRVKYQSSPETREFIPSVFLGLLVKFIAKKLKTI